MKISFNDHSKAAQRIRPYIFKTPVLESTAINQLLGLRVLFKCENLQRIGAFKARGAFNALLSLERGIIRSGVAAHSSGNHAQALALAAKSLGITAHIVMPENSPKVKVDGVRELGAAITFCKPTQEDREKTLADVLEQTGAQFIPPYDHELIIAGQSTVAMEFIEEYPNLDAIFAPLGGGGLLSGTGSATRHFSPGTKVFGAEPENVDDGLRSFNSAQLEKNSPGSETIADGLRTHLSELTLSYILEYIDDIFTCAEQEIVDAMQMIWTNLKVIVEPSAAVPLATLLKNKDRFKNQTVAIILSGGNVDLETVPFLNT